MNQALVTAVASIVLLVSIITKDKNPNFSGSRQVAASSTKKKASTLTQAKPLIEGGDRKHIAKIVSPQGDTIIYRPYFIPKKIVH